jgi:hypothetical protein
MQKASSRGPVRTIGQRLRPGDLCAADDHGERIVNRRIGEAQAALQGGHRHYSLTTEQKFLSEHSGRDAQWRGRHRQDRRSRKGPTQRVISSLHQIADDTRVHEGFS